MNKYRPHIKRMVCNLIIVMMEDVDEKTIWNDDVDWYTSVQVTSVMV